MDTAMMSRERTQRSKGDLTVKASCHSLVKSHMRQKVTVDKLKKFMDELAALARSSGIIYFTGGATALLLGFRDQTIDINIKLDPEPEGVFEAIAQLKNQLDLNVDVPLASPDDFIPATPDWREKSPLIASVGKVQYFHYDLALQALSKVERGHKQDTEDVRNLIGSGHVTIEELRRKSMEIEPRLIRYPAVDIQKFKMKLEKLLKDFPP